MAVYERKLCEVMGLTKDQVRSRRQRDWEYGVHFWTEGRGATVYDMREIKQWQRESMKPMAGAISVTKIREPANEKARRSHSRKEIREACDCRLKRR